MKPKRSSIEGPAGALPGKHWLWLALTLHALMGTGCLLFPPMMNSDSATGFLIWDSWMAGAPWNHLTSANPADISRTVSFAHVWWSPGQYMVVAPWQLLGLSLGQAIGLGGFVATAAALIGFWRLFLSWGFSSRTAGISTFALACNWTLTRTYGDYMGGETALLAVLPWLFLAATRLLQRGRWGDWLILPLIYWLGSMAKNTFTPLFAGLVAGVRTLTLWPMRVRPANMIMEIMRWVLVIGAGHALYWGSHLRFGNSPAAGLGGPLNPDWQFSLLRVLGFPLGSLFSSGTLLGRIFQHPSHPLVTRIHELWPAFVVLALLSVGIVGWVLQREFRVRPRYAATLSGILIASFAFYGLVALWRDTEGIDERFFKPIGFLVLPGVIEAIVTTARRWLAWVLGLTLAGSCAYGVAAYANRAVHLHRLNNVGRRGITQHVLSREALRILHHLDDTLPAGSLIVVPSPEMALELKRTRALATDAALRDAASIRQWKYAGEVPRLVVLSNDSMHHSQQHAALIATFTAYRQSVWSQFHQGTWTVSWTGGPIDLR